MAKSIRRARAAAIVIGALGAAAPGVIGMYKSMHAAGLEQLKKTEDLRDNQESKLRVWVETNHEDIRELRGDVKDLRREIVVLFARLAQDTGRYRNISTQELFEEETRREGVQRTRTGTNAAGTNVTPTASRASAPVAPVPPALPPRTQAIKEKLKDILQSKETDSNIGQKRDLPKLKSMKAAREKILQQQSF